jgi:transcriptional regulator with XRE-family HTH domain
MNNNEIERLVDKFEEDFNTIGELHLSFPEMFKKLLDRKEITKEEFIAETGISGPTFDNFLKEDHDPSLKNVTAFCIAFEIDVNSYFSLLQAGGYSINYRKKRDLAYSFLITDCMGMTIQECNEILKGIGLSDTDLLIDPINS